MRGLAFSALLLGAIGVPSASADHPGGTTDVSTRTVAGERVEVWRHGDPRGEFVDGSDAAAPAPQSIAGRAAAPSTCPTVSSGTDDRANDPHGGAARVIKVIYAHPAGVGNRLPTYGPVIEAGVRSLAEFVASESGGLLSIRFDIGTFEGPHCLDIQKVALPQTKEHYSSPPFDAFDKVAEDVIRRLGPQVGPRNYLIYADLVAPAGIAGEAQALISPGVTDLPSSGPLHDQGGLFSMLYGRGGSDFFGSTQPFVPGTTSRLQVEVALHEVSHTLGAVQMSSPNSSGAGHCNDRYDLMCYEDGGPGSLFVDPNCDGDVSAPPDPYSEESQAWDCNKDDFFNVAPAGGSYLADHWNLAQSGFLCPVSACTPPDTQRPNTILEVEPLAASPLKRAKVRFRSTERSSFTCKLDGRKPKPCSSPFKTKVKRGRHTIRITATDRAGLTDPSPAKTSFRVIKRR